MNKIKEELRLKMLGQLSHDKTELDINNAYEVVKKSVLSFSNFLRENYEMSGGTFRETGTRNYEKLEDLFKIWKNEIN